MSKLDPTLREKFRSDADADLERDLESALAGVSLDALYDVDKPIAKAATGARRGRVISIDAKKDEVFVDFGGKSQGVALLSQV